MTLIDLTGQRFGKLTVLGIDENNKYNSSKKIQWKCQCDCGNICYKTADSLKKPIKQGVKACSKTCGTLIPKGTQFGRLTVLELEEFPNKYKCQCSCGEIVIKNGEYLKSGHTKSCGCYRQEKMSEIGLQYSIKKDITGQRFGNLVAIEPTDKRQNKSIIWKCQCDCGNIHFASVNNLINGYVIHCSNCQTISKGENKIKQILIEAKIPFEQQKTFDSCRNPKTNALLKFDFFINNKYIIEFDGIQHYKEVGGIFPKDRYEQIKFRDTIKDEWCKKNNIPIIRIPYYQLEVLKLNDLLLKE